MRLNQICGAVAAVCALIFAYLQPVLAAGATPQLAIDKPNQIQEKISAASGQPRRDIKVVFIPGILGSKLLKRGTTKDQRQYVWGGGKFDDPDLKYDGKNKLEADFFDKADLGLLSRLFDTNIYGEALLMLRDSEDLEEKDILKFSYDWRQSNALSARDLNGWLCQNKDKLAGNRIIFFAHSMGGLVLKHWFINYYDNDLGCTADEKKWLGVEKVFFAGTPHLGSPKALAALFGEYSLYDNWFVRVALPDGIKTFGYSFDSFYELLPIQHDAECRAFSDKLGLAPAFKDVQSTDANPDIFNIDFMQKYGLPKDIEEDRSAFYEHRLKTILPEAAKNICKLAQYDFKKFGIANVSGFMALGSEGTTKKNTTSMVKGQTGAWIYEDDNGDGTVLRPSSAWKGVLNFISQIQPVESGHMKILDNGAVKVKIQTAVQGMASEDLQQLQRDNPNAYSTVINEFAAEGKLVWSPPDDSELAMQAQKINTKIFEELRMTTEEIAQAAKNARNVPGDVKDLSYVLNDYVASLNGATEAQKLFAQNAAAAELKNFGFDALAKTRYDVFIPQSLEILEQPQNEPYSSELILDLRKATANAFNNRGLILKENGDLQGALDDFEAGADFGSNKALNQLQQMQKLPLFQKLQPQ